MVSSLRVKDQLSNSRLVDAEVVGLTVKVMKNG